MTNGTLDVVPINSAVQNWVTGHADAINVIAESMGVPPEAVVAPLIQEAGTIIFDIKDFDFDDYPEINGNFHPKQSAVHTEKKFKDGFLDTVVSLWPSCLIARDFENRKGDIVTGTGLTIGGRIIDPTENDIGWGNINLGTAILILQDYIHNREYQNDPLHLYQYNKNYAKFAADLIDPSSDVSFAISGLMAKQGNTFFRERYGKDYDTASDQVKSALLTTFFKQGAARIEKHSLAADRKLPDPWASDGGPDIMDANNWSIIEKILKPSGKDNSFQQGAPVEGILPDLPAPFPRSFAPRAGADTIAPAPRNPVDFVLPEVGDSLRDYRGQDDSGQIDFGFPAEQILNAAPVLDTILGIGTAPILPSGQSMPGDGASPTSTGTQALPRAAGPAGEDRDIGILPFSLPPIGSTPTGDAERLDLGLPSDSMPTAYPAPRPISGITAPLSALSDQLRSSSAEPRSGTRGNQPIAPPELSELLGLDPGPGLFGGPADRLDGIVPPPPPPLRNPPPQAAEQMFPRSKRGAGTGSVQGEGAPASGWKSPFDPPDPAILGSRAPSLPENALTQGPNLNGSESDLLPGKLDLGTSAAPDTGFFPAVSMSVPWRGAVGGWNASPGIGPDRPGPTPERASASARSGTASPPSSGGGAAQSALQEHLQELRGVSQALPAKMQDRALSGAVKSISERSAGGPNTGSAWYDTSQRYNPAGTFAGVT